jgi:hypothetical protein
MNSRIDGMEIKLEKRFMKIMYRYLLFLCVAVASAGVISSCSDDDTLTPRVRYVRVTDAAASDSLLVAAGQGQMIAVMGENLGDVRELWVNDQRLSLSPTLITNTAIIARVPSALPALITNKMTLIFGDGFVLEHPFELAVAEPIVTAMASEFVEDGGTAVIKGQYMYAPLTVVFTGGLEATVVNAKLDGTEVQVIVPTGAQPGPITVTTNFGTVESTLHFRDERAFLNYDNLTSNGSWRPGKIVDGGITDKYLRLKGKLAVNETKEDYSDGDGFASQFWAKVNGRPEGNLLPGKPEDYVMKFELRSLSWYGTHLNICFSPWNHDQSNQEYWSNSLNARAYYGPWEASNSNFTTDGKWITVVIPMTDFAYQMNKPSGIVTYTPMALKPEVTGGLSFWLIGSPKSNANLDEIHIDNVRIVPR